MLILWSIKDKWELNSLTPSKEVDRVLFGYSNYWWCFLSFWGTRPTGGIQAEMLTGCPGAGRDGGQNNPLLQLTRREKAFFCHASPVILWGQRKHKDPLGSALMKELRKQARSQVLTNPDSELKSHLAHTQNNQSTPTGVKRVWNVREVHFQTARSWPGLWLSITSLTHSWSTVHTITSPELNQHLFGQKRVNCHRKLPRSHKYLRVTLHFYTLQQDKPTSSGLDDSSLNCSRITTPCFILRSISVWTAHHMISLVISSKRQP